MLERQATVASVYFVKGAHVIMKIIDVHVHACSSSGSTRHTLGLDILHIGITLLKDFPFSPWPLMGIPS